ncbi:hypothetical protein FGG08_005801 [Glutinoglossum americanum]|uniref:COP9 signalosome complex subunit 1 n=1 Tax=Glutinoglossum americanum TaxID=1670608 RepID=A0A9P8I4T3_9PEZI|nr:hypothetical protein FGG08_005801 [Glutinoglossum americanum]
MANRADLPPYLVKRIEEGHLVVLDPPKLDLEAYISNYAGRTRFDRCFVIGQTSSYLAVEALKAAVNEAKKGTDASRYAAAVEALQEAAPDDPDAKLDMNWMEATTKQVKAETDRLEFELKGYKNNLIKESIRMGKEDLGSHYFAIGDLSSAKNAYTGMRDYCTTPKHILDMCLKLIIVGIEQTNWMAVQSNVMKIRSLQRSPDEEAQVQPILSTSMGLAHLASANYRDAALNLVSTNPNLGSRFSQVISPNDVAIYGGLCALSSMDRNELQSKVLDNPNFRNFLELEPHIRRAVSFFCNSKYSQCLEALEAYRRDYLLDIHLQRHVAELYYRIRSKSIVQYFIPFSCVTLSSMASAFVTNEESMESELVEMIQRGILDARIDTQNKLLTSTPQTHRLRTSVHTSALLSAKNYEQTARLRLMRMNIVSAGLEVRAPKGTVPATQQVSGVTPSFSGSAASGGGGEGGGRSGLRSGVGGGGRF